MAEECVGFFVAGGDCDVFGGGSGFEESADGVRGAAGLPVGLDCGFDGEFEGGAAFAVDGVDRCFARDEEFDDFGTRSPGSYVESSAVWGDVEVAVAEVESVGWDAEVEEIADAFDVVVAGELGEESSTVGDEFGFGCGEGADGFGFVLCAGG